MSRVVNISREQILWRQYVRAFEESIASPSLKNLSRLDNAYRRWRACFLNGE